MFSATEPLASSPLATAGTTKLVNGSAALTSPHQVLAGTAERRKMHYGSAALTGIAQTVQGTSQTIRVLHASGAVQSGAQTVLGTALYTRIIQGSAALEPVHQLIEALCYVTVQQQASADLLSAPQVLQGTATVTKTANGAADLVSAAHVLIGSGTRIRILSGVGDLNAAPQTLYGSEFWPVVIKTPSAPLNLYEVSLKDTSEPYSTTNKYLTVYQVPGYLEQQANGSFIPRNVTAIITAMSACTADGTPQPISIIVVKVDGVVVYPIIPALDITNGVENIIPMRDFNLVTGDVIQVKSLGSGDVTITLSMLLNTQTYYEVL